MDDKGAPLQPPHLRADARSKSYNGSDSTGQGSTNAAYEQSMSDIKRLRSTRLDKHLSNTMKRARASRIIDGTEGYEAGGNTELRGGMQIVNERDGQPDMDTATLAVNSLALDDIARMAAMEQQREQRPNAFRAGGSALLGQENAKVHSGHRRDFSGAQDLQNMIEGRSRTFFSELSPLEYFKLKGLAVLQLGLLLDENQYNQEDLLDLIESKKNNFWGKIGFGKAFKGDKAKPKKPQTVEKPTHENATFRQSLEYLVEKKGAECTEGVGPGALKVPALLQDAITAMRNMDMSVEGVFRKNGNLKALRELEVEVDQKGVEQVDLSTKNPVILANLMKRFLRVMPDPVLTLKLYRLFMTANGKLSGSSSMQLLTTIDIEEEDRRKKVLHLVLCLLPKAHRDTMEVLFCFLNWVSSFHTVDEETGNKMDTWNIATVIAPNILRESNDKEVRSVDQGAVKVVFDLIENNDEFSEVSLPISSSSAIGLPPYATPATLPPLCHSVISPTPVIYADRSGAPRDHGAARRRQRDRHERQGDYATVGTEGQGSQCTSRGCLAKQPSRHSKAQRRAQRAPDHTGGQQLAGFRWRVCSTHGRRRRTATPGCTRHGRAQPAIRAGLPGFWRKLSQRIAAPPQLPVACVPETDWDSGCGVNESEVVRFMCIGVAPAFGVSASVVATASGACSFSVSRLTSPGFRRRTYFPQRLHSADLTWSAWSGAEQVGWLLHWIRCGHDGWAFSAPLARHC
jgi:hypothetical protein